MNKENQTPLPGVEPNTFSLATFGCQMNVYDAEWLCRALKAQGMREVPPERAQVHILTTCSVRDKPEQKVYSHLGRIRRIIDSDETAFAVVGGCVAQQIGKGFFGRFPFVRLVFGTDATHKVPGAVSQLLREPGTRLCLTEFLERYPERESFPGEQAPGAGQGTGECAGPGQGFVSIMQGCDNFCAYCIVPYTRGRQKSRRADDILAECRGMVARGAREITLLGQNVNSYGQDRAARKSGQAETFAGLLRKVAGIEGLRRLRFTTSHPKDLDADVIRAFGELETLGPQLHLPLQSGSDRVLKAMGRKYDMARYREIVAGLRAARPELLLSTDLMVGFPGESEEDFEHTLAAMREIEFSTSFSFMYSDRPGVRAERMKSKVPHEVKAERLARLQALQNRFSTEALAAMVGRDVEVLLDGTSGPRDNDGDGTRPNGAGASDSPAGEPGREEGEASRARAIWWRGRDQFNHVVNVVPPLDGAQARTEDGVVGKLVSARIIEAKKHSLLAECRGTPW